jgi:hypothetical protein
MFVTEFSQSSRLLSSRERENVKSRNSTNYHENTTEYQFFKRTTKKQISQQITPVKTQNQEIPPHISKTYYRRLKFLLAGSCAVVGLLMGNAASAHSLERIGNVFYIYMENHNWTQPMETWIPIPAESNKLRATQPPHLLTA